jgi:hypothetical protein
VELLIIMTTKTIPEYLEEEGHKDKDAQLRMEEEAARIRPLHHGHHRAAKQPKQELPTSITVAVKTKKQGATTRKKTRVAQKTTAKAHKRA